MRYLKLAIISFIFFALIFTIISLFIPSHIRITKAINIRARKDSVMAMIKDPSRWKRWYPGLDTAEVLYVEGHAQGLKLDKGPIASSYILIDKQDPDEITADFIGYKRKPIVYGWKAFDYPSGDSVSLQWYMDFHLRWYPWEKFRSLFIESSNGPTMMKGLANLKGLVEGK